MLADLARGSEINAAIASAHSRRSKQLEKEFAAFAQQQRREDGPGPGLDEAAATGGARSERRSTNSSRRIPTITVALTEQAKLLDQREEMGRGQGAAAEADRAVSRATPAADSAYALLARVHRELGETDAESARCSTTLADRAATRPDAYQRLMELDRRRTQDWPEVVANAERTSPSIRWCPRRTATEAEAARGARQKPPPSPPTARCSSSIRPTRGGALPARAAAPRNRRSGREARKCSRRSKKRRASAPRSRCSSK